MIDGKVRDGQIENQASRQALEARRADEARQAAEHALAQAKPAVPKVRHSGDGFEKVKPVTPFASIGLHGIAPGELHDIGRPDVSIPQPICEPGQPDVSIPELALPLGPPDVSIPEPVPELGRPDVGIPDPVDPRFDPRADLDGNGQIDIRDLARVASQYGQSASRCAADLDGNRRVDDADLQVVASALGTQAPKIEHRPGPPGLPPQLADVLRTK